MMYLHKSDQVVPKKDPFQNIKNTTFENSLIMNKLTILQHNVLLWNTSKQSLINYPQISPQITLINSHVLKSERFLKISGYKTYKINTSESIADGSAIAVKYNLTYKVYDDYDTDVLAMEVDTTLGPQIIATMYLPPRRPYVPFPDFYRLLNNNIPT